MARVSNCNEFYPGSMLSPSVMAEILYRKYALFLPLYRIEQAFRNEGLEHISRQTMSNWIRETVQTPIFTEDAMRSIFTFSGGNPRLINRACTQSLFYGSQMKQTCIDSKSVDIVLVTLVTRCQ